MTTVKPLAIKQKGRNVPEAVELAYYSMLFLMIESKAPLNRIKDFRYSSTEESALWEDYLSDKFKESSLHNNKVLCFYAYIEELRSLFSRDAFGGDSESFLKKQDTFIFMFRCAILARTLRHIFDTSAGMLDEMFSYFDQSLNYFYSASLEVATQYESSLFWSNSGKGVYTPPSSILNLFSSANFIAKEEEWSRTISSRAKKVVESKILKKIFPIKQPISQSTSNYINEEISPRKKVLIMDNYPFWATPTESSFFAYGFYHYIDTDESREGAYSIIEDMERNYLYFSSSEEAMKDVKKAAFSEFAKQALFSKDSSFSNKDLVVEMMKSNGSTSPLWESLMSESLLTINIFAENIKIFKNTISHIIYQEYGHIEDSYRVLSNEGLESEEEYSKLVLLFFTNVFKQIEDALLEQGVLCYSSLVKEEDLVAFSDALFDVIYQMMEKLKREKKWLV